MTLDVVHSCPSWLVRTETWLYTQIAHLQEPIRSHIVCEFRDNEDQFPMPDVYCARDEPRVFRMIERGLRRYRLPSVSTAIARVARRTKARLLHSHYGLVGHQNLLTARVAGLRHIVTFYGKDASLPRDRPRWRGRYRRLFRQVDLVLCEGPAMAETIARIGCPVRKIRIHRLGVGVGAIEYRPRSWTPGQPLRVLIAAAFREKKGIPDGISALAELRRRGTEVELTIIGDAHDHPGSRRENTRIRRAIANGGLEPVTQMLGFVSHERLFEEAYRHHIFVAPSLTASDGDSEGGAPIALVEMAATGIPIVSTRHCDIPQVLTHEVSGLLADERDVAGLVSCLEWLVRDPSRWQALVRRAREHVEAEFAAPAQARQLAAIYQEVAGQTVRK